MYLFVQQIFAKKKVGQVGTALLYSGCYEFLYLNSIHRIQKMILSGDVVSAYHTQILK